ncbi:NAD-dependent succinate-semialdehyde dehydrogenase [Rhodococcoides fascians]|uniref:NAD-dependent succinate-semialdehyde dehydrogenase n=1 Tax=Rhodococcoides fascians TaxID=1828 RepID=UPI000564D173|nr:NAD-dependent succinate-semialdehyde dehydrogenase [Rhodococcus fascians]
MTDQHKIRTVNPATDKILAEYPALNRRELSDVAARSQAAYESWRRTPIAERASALGRVADLIEQRRNELAAIATEEMGKPISESFIEVDYIFRPIFRYYADHAAELLADDRIRPLSGDDVVVRTMPIGPVLGIMPWNFPYYQVARFAAPNLLLGNTIILKHAPGTTGSALVLEQILNDAGIPQDAYINVIAETDDLEVLIADNRVRGVSLTGSERAGAAVAALAGQHLKKVVLELGGSDPFIVLDDHNIDEVVQTAVQMRISNAGQSCISPKRVIIVDSVYEEFARKYGEAMGAVVPGDPHQAETALGPLSSRGARDGVISIVDDAIGQGATVLAGGKSVDGPGAFMQPTVLADVTPEMRAWREEIFGPVGVLYRARDASHAVEIANDSDYGLAGSVWGADLDLVRTVAEQLEVGAVGINAMAGSEASVPFGGVKRSGVGRELGRYGLDEFSNKKVFRTPVTADV